MHPSPGPSLRVAIQPGQSPGPTRGDRSNTHTDGLGEGPCRRAQDTGPLPTPSSNTHTKPRFNLPGGDCVQGKSEMASGRFQPPHKDAPTDGGRSRGQATPSSWLGLRLPGLSGILQNCLSAFLAPTSHLPCKVGKPGTEQGHLSRGCPPGRGLWHRQPLRVTTKGGGPLGTGASQQLGDVALQHQALHWQQKCGLWGPGRGLFPPPTRLCPSLNLACRIMC